MLKIPKPFPVAATLVMLAIVLTLCRLGYWQYERLVWKNALQANLDREFAQDAAQINLTSADASTLKAGELKRGSFSGHLDLTKLIFLGGQIVDGKQAFFVIAPLTLQDGQHLLTVIGSTHSVFTNADPGQTVGGTPTQISGVLRHPQWNYFTPDNMPEKNLWYRAAPDEIAQHLNLDKTLAPLFYLEAVPDDLSTKLAPVTTPRVLRNDHRNYMIFWYTMAVIMVVIYGLRFFRVRDET